MGMGFRRDLIRAIKVFDYAIKRFDFFLLIFDHGLCELDKFVVLAFLHRNLGH